MKTSSSKLRNARISLKHSLILCKKLKGKKLMKAVKFLENLAARKVSIDGKYYTKAVNHFLEFLKTAQADAKQKGLDLERVFIKQIKADKGLRFYRPRSLWHLRRQRVKSVNLSVELEER
jgi:large subunit ribosomal protein L22